VASQRPRYPASWQRLETLGFPSRTEPRVLALSAYAYQRGVSLLLAENGVIDLELRRDLVAELIEAAQVVAVP
jgi:hypothetical protein